MSAPAIGTLHPAPRRLLSRLLPTSGPARGLAAATLVNSIGTGAFAATCTIYYVHVVGLSIAKVGTGLALAGCAGLLMGIPSGHLADRVGAKQVFVTLTVVQGSAIAGYAVIATWPQFVIASAVAIGAERAVAGVRNAFIASVVVGTDRVGVRAYLRSVSNAGSSLGAGAASLVLLADTPAAFRVLLLFDAATCYLCAILVLRIRSAPAAPGDVAGRQTGWLIRERRFLTMAAAQAILSLHTSVLTIAVPLWIVTRTEQPKVTIAILLTASTAGAVLLQVPVSKRAGTPRGAARAAWQAGGYLAAGCLAFPCTATGGRWAAAVLLAAGGAARLVGELLQAASGWAMSFTATPPGQAGLYQSTYSTAYSVATMAGPAVCTAVVAAPGPIGWFALAAIFAIAGITAAVQAPRPALEDHSVAANSLQGKQLRSPYA
jgi:MFS family permease